MTSPQNNTAQNPPPSGGGRRRRPNIGAQQFVDHFGQSWVRADGKTINGGGSGNQTNLQAPQVGAPRRARRGAPGPIQGAPAPPAQPAPVPPPPPPQPPAPFAAQLMNPQLPIAVPGQAGPFGLPAPPQPPPALPPAPPPQNPPVGPGYDLAAVTASLAAMGFEYEYEDKRQITGVLGNTMSWFRRYYRHIRVEFLDVRFAAAPDLRPDAHVRIPLQHQDPILITVRFIERLSLCMFPDILGTAIRIPVSRVSRVMVLSYEMYVQLISPVNFTLANSDQVTWERLARTTATIASINVSRYLNPIIAQNTLLIAYKKCQSMFLSFRGVDFQLTPAVDVRSSNMVTDLERSLSPKLRVTVAECVSIGLACLLIVVGGPYVCRWGFTLLGHVFRSLTSGMLQMQQTAYQRVWLEHYRPFRGASSTSPSAPSGAISPVNLKHLASSSNGLLEFRNGVSWLRTLNKGS